MIDEVEEGGRLGVVDEVARDERPLTEADSNLFAAELTTDPLGRILRASEDLAVLGSASLSFAVLLASDMADGGRTTLGVAKIEDSRRRGAFAPGVWLIDALVPMRLFNYG